MVLVDLFSGYGGFHLGLEQAGFKFTKTYFSEIDKHAIANYRYNFKDAEYVGSVTDVQQWRIERPNIITFGSPCQDFSLAGKRAGMDGERSSLITYAIDAIKRFRPDFFIWENVKGTFSSNNGADFWAIIQAFADIGGYRLEWQLLNTAWFLPQNRERIYLIGHLAKPGRSFRQVFPIGENEGLAYKAQQKTGKHIANTLSSAEYKLNCETNLVQPVLTPDRKEKRQNGPRFKQPGEPAHTLTAQDKHGIMVTQLNPSKESGGKQPYQHNRVYDKDGLAPALDSAAGRWATNTTQIRRLTEIECERLQGLPDGFTQYGMYENKAGELEKREISSTQRYKLCGNGVTATVVQEIGKRLIDNY